MARGPDFALATKLAALGFGTFFQDSLDAGTDPAEVDGSVFASEMPQRPLDATAVIPSFGGRIPNDVSEEHIMEIRVRHPISGTAYTRALNISAALTPRLEGNLGGLIMRVTPLSVPVPLGRDENADGGAWVYLQTVRVQLKAGQNTVP